MTTEQAYTEVLNAISDLLGAKHKLQNTFIFKGFRNNEYPHVSFDGNLQCGLIYQWAWMTIEEAIERMEENGYIDINDFEL
jgi:hypothetical protein